MWISEAVMSRWNRVRRHSSGEASGFWTEMKDKESGIWHQWSWRPPWPSLRTMFRMWVSFSLDLFHQNSIKSTFSKHQWFKGMQLKMAYNNLQNRRCSTKMTHWLPVYQEMWWILEVVFYRRNKAHCGTGWLDWRKYRNWWCERVTVNFAVLSSKLKGYKVGSDMLHTFYILYRFGYILYVFIHIYMYTCM